MYHRLGSCEEDETAWLRGWFSHRWKERQEGDNGKSGGNDTRKGNNGTPGTVQQRRTQQTPGTVQQRRT